MKFDVTANGMCIFSTDNFVLTVGKLSGNQFSKLASKTIDSSNS